jgi:predicted MFS family arabinose efflux permease
MIPGRDSNMTAVSLRPALALGLSAAAGHGIARYGYALLMPAMRDDLHWTFEQASWMNTANALGYVAGTISGFLMLRRLAPRTLFRCGLLLTVGSVLALSFRGHFALLILLRVLSGLGTAWTYSTGGALVLEGYSATRLRGAAIGLFFGCTGIGMAVTAVTAPALLHLNGVQTWARAWLILGAACALLAAWPWWESRNYAATAKSLGARLPNLTRSGMALTAYFFFAVAHTGYIFFVFAWTQQQHLPWWQGADMWAVMGAGVFLSPFLWQGALSKWRASATLATCSFMVALGAAIPLMQPDITTVTLSAIFVGAALFIGPAAMAVLARQSFPAEQWSLAIMAFGVVFAVGQSIGSWGFGIAADALSLDAVLAISSAGLLIAAVLAASHGRGLPPAAFK